MCRLPRQCHVPQQDGPHFSQFSCKWNHIIISFHWVAYQFLWLNCLFSFTIGLIKCLHVCFMTINVSSGDKYFTYLLFSYYLLHIFVSDLCTFGCLYTLYEAYFGHIVLFLYKIILLFSSIQFILTIFIMI